MADDAPFDWNAWMNGFQAPAIPVDSTPAATSSSGSDGGWWTDQQVADAWKTGNNPDPSTRGQQQAADALNWGAGVAAQPKSALDAIWGGTAPTTAPAAPTTPTHTLSGSLVQPAPAAPAAAPPASLPSTTSTQQSLAPTAPSHTLSGSLDQSAPPVQFGQPPAGTASADYERNQAWAKQKAFEAQQAGPPATPAAPTTPTTSTGEPLNYGQPPAGTASADYERNQLEQQRAADALKWGLSQINTGAGDLDPMDPSLAGVGETAYNTPGVKGVLSAPTRSQGTLDTIASQLSNPTAYEDQIKQSMQGLSSLGTSRSYGQEQARMAGAGLGEVAGNGAAQGVFNTVGKDIYGSPTAAESTFNSTVNPALTQNTALENWYAQNGGAMNKSGQVALAGRDITSGINQAGQAGQFYGQNVSAMNGPGYQEQLADQYQPLTSYSENLMTGAGGQGLDDYYNRLIDRGTRQLSEAGAARGSFNSGASLRGVEELNRDMSAQQAKDYIGLANQADVQRLGLLGYGRDVMAGGDTGRDARFSTGMTGAQTADQSTLAQAKTKLDLAREAEVEKEGRYKLAADAANMTGAQTIDRNTALENAAVAESNTALARATQGVNAGSTVDKTKIDALTQMGQTGLTADTTRQNALSAQATAGAQGQSALVSRANALTSAAQSADSVATTRASANQAAATAAQAVRDGRIDALLGRQIQDATNKALVVASSLSANDTEQLNLIMQQIQASLSVAGVDVSASKQSAADLNGALAKLTSIIDGVGKTK